MARTRKLDGVDTVARAFRRMTRDGAERVTDALNRGADEIAARARVAVPVDSGDMRDTIDVDRTEIRAGATGNPTVYVVAGTTPLTQAYARALEFGRPEGGAPAAAARPFLFPAYWSLRKRVRGRIKRAINRAARDAARAFRGSSGGR